MRKILGIDPGIGICGFGLIAVSGRSEAKALDFGVITTQKNAPLAERLLELYDSLQEVFDETNPDVVAIEKLFFVQNITTGIAVAEARGLVLLTAAQRQIPIFEYGPKEIKMALTGYGAATKRQMQEMVKDFLQLEKLPKPDDAADALAAAITHSLIKII